MAGTSRQGERVMASEDDEREFRRVYGDWAVRTPADVAGLFQGYPGTWWVAGGWALESFGAPPRPHGDIDPVVLRDELPLLRRHLAGRLDAWSASSGALLPLWPDDRPDAPADEVLLPGGGQVWARRSARHPWEYDILLNPGTPRQWVYKRDARVRLPMERALFARDGIRYLQPEVQLLLKAARPRAKDTADLAAVLPLLDAARREWLREVLSLTLPGHPWLARLA